MSLEKWQIWTSKFVSFFLGNRAFATVKRLFLFYFDLTNSGIFFSLDLSQHLGSLLKQFLVFIDEAPLPHFGM